MQHRQSNIEKLLVLNTTRSQRVQQELYRLKNLENEVNNELEMAINQEREMRHNVVRYKHSLFKPLLGRVITSHDIQKRRYSLMKKQNALKLHADDIVKIKDRLSGIQKDLKVTQDSYRQLSVKEKKYELLIKRL